MNMIFVLHFDVPSDLKQKHPINLSQEEKSKTTTEPLKEKKTQHSTWGNSLRRALVIYLAGDRWVQFEGAARCSQPVQASIAQGLNCGVWTCPPPILPGGWATRPCGPGWGAHVWAGPGPASPVSSITECWGQKRGHPSERRPGPQGPLFRLCWVISWVNTHWPGQTLHLWWHCHFTLYEKPTFSWINIKWRTMLRISLKTSIWVLQKKENLGPNVL